jgi:acyl-CoA thioester hydrolase
MSKDCSRWSLINHFIKDDGTVAAKLTVDGAWMDLIKRKLAVPPNQIFELFDKIDRTEDFEWVER